MKKIIFFILFSFLLQSWQCSRDSISSQTKIITSNELKIKKQDIINYISSFNCTIGCNYIALGSKPCGGPREYIAYPGNINETILTEMVEEYNQMEYNYNIQNEIISDCAMVMPPNEVNCVDGICKIIN